MPGPSHAFGDGQEVPAHPHLTWATPYEPTAEERATDRQGHAEPSSAAPPAHLLDASLADIQPARPVVDRSRPIAAGPPRGFTCRHVHKRPGPTETVIELGGSCSAPWPPWS